MISHRPSFAGLLLVLAVLVHLPASAAQLKAIQSGEVSIFTGSTSVAVPVTAVNTSKTFLVFSTRSSSDDPDETQVAGNFTTGRNDELTFARNGTVGSVPVYWYLVEFVSGVSVQRGSANLTGTTTIVNIGAVDLTKSFPLISYREPGTNWGGKDFVRGSLPSPTQLQLDVAAAPTAPAVVEWQVVEYADAVVHPHNVTMASNQSLLGVTPGYPIDASKMWLIYSYTTGDSGTKISRHMVRGFFDGGGGFSFDRYVNGVAVSISAFVVEFTDVTTVQQGTASWGIGPPLNLPVTIPSGVDLARSIAAGGYLNKGGKSNLDVNNSGISTAWAQMKLTGPTSMIVHRGRADEAAQIEWSVVEFSAPASTSTLSGRVFEDADFAGTASAYDGGAGDKALQGVDVELYDAGTDAYLQSVTTDASGNYTLTGLVDGSYKVRVRSATLGSGTATPLGGLNASVPGTWPNPLPEMAWGNGAALYGGQSPTTDDTATGDNAGPGDTWVPVTVSGANVTGVDVGFAYNLIVNTLEDSNDDDARSVQGSLRQFIKNANAIGAAGGTTANASEFRIPVSDPNYSGGVFTITPTDLLPALADSGTTLDASTQGDNTSQTNSGDLGTGGKVGVDQLDLSKVPAPEIEIAGSETLPYGLQITGSSATLRGLAIYGFGLGNTGEGNVVVADAITGPLIERNVIGSGAAAFTDPGSGFRGWENVYSGGADNGTIRNNLIGFGGVRGILLAGGSTGWTIEDNELRDNSLESTGGDGLAIDPGQAVVTGNLIVGSASQGVVASGSSGSTFTNNTISGNGIGTDTASGAAAGMTFRPTASGMTVFRNEFIANYAAGLSVNDGSTGIKITQNSFRDNGTIVSRKPDPKTDQIGIDLNNPTDNANQGTSPYVSLNDPGDTPSGGNNQVNYPVLDTAVINGTNLELTGWARPGSVIELYLRDTDPSLFGEGLTYTLTLTENGTGGGGEDPYTDLDTGPATLYSDPVNGLNQGTDTTNRFRFVFPKPAAVSVGSHLTATARDGSNNTSEFGGRVVVAAVQADLTLSKTDSPDPAPLDGPLVYTLLITNNGPGTATGVTVTDTLPASVTLQSATPSQGSCSGTTTITCNLGAMVSSGTASVEILVTTTATGMITNNASVSADQTDPVPGDNAAVENTDVVADSAILDLPLTQYRRIHGFIDYTVAGGSLRTMPNGGGGAACAVGASSSDSIAGIPGTATIVSAFLYWAGSGATVDADVTFDGGAVTADRTYQGRFSLGANDYEFFGGFEDVTAQVVAKRNGSYSFADLTVDTANPYCNVRAVLAGWSLVVVYEDTTLSGKTLVLYDGFDIERNGASPYLLTGIYSADPPEAKTTFLVWEGDEDLSGTNEFLEFNATKQSDGLNPVNNVYNSTINSSGVTTSYGMDLDTFDVSGLVNAGDTLATVQVSVGPDLVILNAVVLQVKSNIIVGNVFEDVNYGGGDGRNRATAAAAAPTFTVNRPAATVELYDAAGNFLRTTTTGAAGEYGFAGLVDGTYRVRVVNDTVNSSRPGSTGAELAVQTYRTDASTGVAVAVAGEVGGAVPSGQDAPANVGMANLGSITAQSVTPVLITTGVAVPDVDFGYNFDTIVNTNDSGQGSLRQFIKNSNLLTNADLDQDDAPVGVSALTKNLGDEHSIFMIPAAELMATLDGGGGTVMLIQPSTGLDPIVDADTVLDGRTQTALTGDTNGAVAEVTTGPEVIIDLQGTLAAEVVTIRANDSVVDSLGLTGALGAGRDGIDAASLSGAEFRNNTIFDNGALGIYLSAVTGSSVTDNVIRGNGVAEATADGILLIDASAGNTISGNQIVANAAFGIELSPPGASDGNTITGNLIKGNGVSASDENAGIKVDDSDDSSFTLNTITQNAGDGIVVTSGDVGNLISQNSIFDNGELAIDLSLNSNNGGDGVTLNDDPDDPGGGNNRQNFPVITSAGWNGANTVVGGTLTSTPGATFDIEIFSGSVCNGAVNGSPQADPYGEGETYRVTANVTDGDADGSVTFSANVPVDLTGQQITATATDTSNDDTSEFSACYTVSTLALVKRAFQADGTPIASGSTLPAGMPVTFLLYVSNEGGAVLDASLQDVLDPLFLYVGGSIRYDNSVAACAGVSCTPAEEAAILGAAEAGTAGTDAINGDVVSFTGVTLDLGDNNVANAQLDIAAGKVWAVVFTIRIQ